MQSHDGHDHAHGHAHDHGHHHGHHHGDAGGGALAIALALTAGYAIVEALGGWFANSLALISDAGHMAADAGALAVALIAARLSARPVSSRNTYGYGRAEVIGAFVNALTILAVVVWIVVEAVGRAVNPPVVAGVWVMVIAGIGLLVNLVVLWLLSRGAQGLNNRAAMLHVVGDLLGSVAAIVAGAVVHFTGWNLADPILSVLVALLILKSTWGVARESAGVLMEGVPVGLDTHKVGMTLARIEGVVSVHDLHVWQMHPGRVALSAHVLVREAAVWPPALGEARRRLREEFGIDHVTLQPEWTAGELPARVIPLKVAPASKETGHA